MVVTFPSVGSQVDQEVIHVVLGHCNTCTIQGEGEGEEELKPYDLKYPDWQTSLNLVARLYPAGTVAAGICLRIDKTKEGQEVEKELAELCSTLLKESHLKVEFYL